MHRTKGMAILAAAALAISLCPQFVLTQSCQDDEAMVKDYQKSLTELVGTVKKESLQDFQKAYHQKSCMTKLTLCLSMLNGLVQCLDKASHDTAAAKEDVDAAKAKLASYTKMKSVVESARDALKSAESAQQAKAVIEKISLTD